MKKFIIIVFGIFAIISCGPKRMGCGARGICQLQEHQNQTLLNKIKE
jgi:hypothetical protein